VTYGARKRIPLRRRRDTGYKVAVCFLPLADYANPPCFKLRGQTQPTTHRSSWSADRRARRITEHPASISDYAGGK